MIEELKDNGKKLVVLIAIVGAATFACVSLVEKVISSKAANKTAQVDTNVRNGSCLVN